jgi:hypothetical protein
MSLGRSADLSHREAFTQATAQVHFPADERQPYSGSARLRSISFCGQPWPGQPWQTSVHAGICCYIVTNPRCICESTSNPCSRVCRGCACWQIHLGHCRSVGHSSRGSASCGLASHLQTLRSCSRCPDTSRPRGSIKCQLSSGCLQGALCIKKSVLLPLLVLAIT